MITEISRTLSGTYIAANTTVMFDSNPYLIAGNDLVLYFTDNDSRYATTVSSVSGNTAVVSFADSSLNNKHVGVKTPNYASGLTGAQDSWNWSFTNPPNAIIQVSSTGGSANVILQASSDNQHWINLATLAITTANGNTAYTNVTAPWAYGRISITDISANQSITINKSI